MKRKYGKKELKVLGVIDGTLMIQSLLLKSGEMPKWFAKTIESLVEQGILKVDGEGFSRVVSRFDIEKEYIGMTAIKTPRIAAKLGSLTYHDINYLRSLSSRTSKEIHDTEGNIPKELQYLDYKLDQLYMVLKLHSGQYVSEHSID